MTVTDTLLACLPGAPEYAYDWQGLRNIPVLGTWFDRMQKTPQDPVWHGEGDVWTHTRLIAIFRGQEVRADILQEIVDLLHGAPPFRWCHWS